MQHQADGQQRPGERPHGVQRLAQAEVVDWVVQRIERALSNRQRYRYVRPRVEREGLGWKVVSPNCSRNIDAQGGEIPIAWFQPGQGNRWRLHAYDHAAGAWVLQADDLALAQALALVCADDARLYWP